MDLCNRRQEHCSVMPSIAPQNVVPRSKCKMIIGMPKSLPLVVSCFLREFLLMPHVSYRTPSPPRSSRLLPPVQQLEELPSTLHEAHISISTSLTCENEVHTGWLIGVICPPMYCAPLDAGIPGLHFHLHAIIEMTLTS